MTATNPPTPQSGDHTQDLPRLTWMTSAADFYEHAVSEENVAAAHGRNGCDYLAICGHGIAPCALTAPPGRPCPRCHAVLAGHHNPLATRPA
ncbi:MAG: hypothetical protein ACR2GH_20590 [Pseudonocardia sp.]